MPYTRQSHTCRADQRTFRPEPFHLVLLGVQARASADVLGCCTFELVELLVTLGGEGRDWRSKEVESLWACPRCFQTDETPDETVSWFARFLPEERASTRGECKCRSIVIIQQVRKLFSCALRPR